MKMWMIVSVLGVIGLGWFALPFGNFFRLTPPSRLVLQPETTDEAYFPEASGLNLSGDEFNFPDDFAAPYNIVLLAYDQDHQYDVYTWVPLLEELEADFSDVRYYELPTLPEYNPLFRTQIDTWMRQGIPDPNTRARTITLYLDVEAFNEALNIEDRTVLRVVLVTPEGEILWQEQGGYSAEKEATLRDALVAAQS